MSSCFLMGPRFYKTKGPTSNSTLVAQVELPVLQGFSSSSPTKGGLEHSSEKPVKSLEANKKGRWFAVTVTSLW